MILVIRKNSLLFSLDYLEENRIPVFYGIVFLIVLLIVYFFMVKKKFAYADGLVLLAFSITVLLNYKDMLLFYLTSRPYESFVMQTALYIYWSIFTVCYSVIAGIVKFLAKS